METYLGVKAVKEKGALCANKEHKQRDRYRIIAILNNGYHEIAEDVTEKREYDVMYGAYNRGTYIEFSIYLLPENEVKNCHNVD